MHRWTLRRVSWTPNETYGNLIRWDGFPICVTLEDPWRENMTGESCIPEGCYNATPYSAPTYGKTWQIQVPRRSAILIHAGNTEDNTRGCILLGSTWGERSKLDILASKTAVKRFHTEQPWEDFWLDVRNP